MFPLSGVDMILGVAWLEKLGNVEVNWHQMTMKFLHQGIRVKFEGDPLLARAIISVLML